MLCPEIKALLVRRVACHGNTTHAISALCIICGTKRMLDEYFRVALTTQDVSKKRTLRKLAQLSDYRAIIPENYPEIEYQCIEMGLDVLFFRILGGHATREKLSHYLDYAMRRKLVHMTKAICAAIKPHPTQLTPRALSREVSGEHSWLAEGQDRNWRECIRAFIMAFGSWAIAYIAKTLPPDRQEPKLPAIELLLVNTLCSKEFRTKFLSTPDAIYTMVRDALWMISPDAIDFLNAEVMGLWYMFAIVHHRVFYATMLRNVIAHPLAQLCTTEKYKMTKRAVEENPGYMKQIVQHFASLPIPGIYRDIEANSKSVVLEKVRKALDNGTLKMDKEDEEVLFPSKKRARS